MIDDGIIETTMNLFQWFQVGKAMRVDRVFIPEIKHVFIRLVG